MGNSRKVQKGRWAALAALAGLCVASLSLPAAQARREVRAEGAVAVPAAAFEAQAAAQPKANGKIAFTSGRGTEALDIYVMNPDGSGLARLTDGRSYNFSPAWSPDGRTIAFVSNRDGRLFAVHLMNADGTNVRRLTSGTAEDEASPAWSPDGTRVAFSRGGGPCPIVQPNCPGPDIYVVDADGTDERQLTEGRVGNMSPTWSPDGTKIAFSSVRDRNAEIYVMNADGTNQVNLTKSAQSEDWEPAWSPDGQKILFTALRGDRYDIFVMNADGTGQTNLTNNQTTGFVENPAWSPDGTKVLFTRSQPAPGSPGDSRDVYAMDADGSDPVRLTSDPAFDMEPDWQPLALAANGPVAFTSERDGNPEVYRMNPDGGAQTNLTLSAARDFTPVWSPDGTKVLFASDRGVGQFQRTQFYVMNADGTGVTKITDFPDVTDTGFSEPSWSPDSTKIVFVRSAFATIHNVVVMNADGSGGSTVAVTRGFAGDVDPAWSPDGTRIAYVGTESAAGGPGAPHTYLWVINADGTGKTRLADARVPPAAGPAVAVGGPAWSPDGTRLAFASNRDGDAEIYTVAASGGEAARVTDNAAHDALPAWSPDGQRIVFTSDRDGNTEIYSANADGSNQVRLTNSAAPDYDPDWASAGARPALPHGLSTLQFDTSLYTVEESGAANSGVPVLQVTVTRLGDRTREATVDYRTVDLCADTPGASCFRTASERSDFTIAAGRLRFAPGETTKTFVVHVTNDLSVEGDEVFAVELTNAAGAGLGGQARAGVTILDDDTQPPAGNPIDDREFFVRQHYLDFLNREPDDEGFRFWVGQIPERCNMSVPPTDAQCLAARENVSGAFFLSIEFQETGFLVHRVYHAAFGRFPRFREEFLPDTQELGRDVIVNQPGWEQRLEQNKQAFALRFVRRADFLTRFPESMSPTAFVLGLTQFTGDAITPAERDQLIAQLTANNTGEGRAQVLRRVVEDADFARQQLNRAFVLMQYFGYLRRNPTDPPDADLSGYNFWLTKLNNHNGDFRAAEMVRSFLLSGEYRSRFTQ